MPKAVVAVEDGTTDAFDYIVACAVNTTIIYEYCKEYKGAIQREKRSKSAQSKLRICMIETMVRDGQK